MKALSFIAVMAVIGAVGGAAYAEYDRVTSAAFNNRNHVFQITRTYIDSEELALNATSSGVRQCGLELYFVEFPPVLTDFITKQVAIDYKIVRKHGNSAADHSNEIEDLRNELSSTYYTDIDQELETLPPESLKRTLKAMKDFNSSRTDISRCIHKNAYQNLLNDGHIKS